MTLDIDTLSLLKSGWQSWSYVPYGEKKIIEIPQCIYSPKMYKGLPKKRIDVNIKKPAYGWCSWYAYSWGINENRILKNARFIQNDPKLPLEYILIDAGWTNAGDWQSAWKYKFPKGLENTVNKIKSLGLKAGIWIAPFMVDPWSNLSKKHPDWLVKNYGLLVDGFRLTPWDRFLPFKKWILDYKNGEAKKYILDSIDWLVSIGFEMIKLDFLYSIYFDSRLTIEEADEIISDLLTSIRLKHPKLYTIGCGCPLVPAVGNVDSMRVSSDSIVSPFVRFIPFSNLFDKYFIYNKVIRSIESRLWTKKYWNIDPDAFVCRHNVGYSNEQIIKHQQLAKASEGNIFLGDDLTKLSKRRLEKFIYPLFN